MLAKSNPSPRSPLAREGVVYERARQLAVSLGARTMDEARAALKRIGKVADVVELRLDFFEEPYDLPGLLADRPIPVVVTNRPVREGGRSTQTESERLDVLVRAARLGAEYVDVEWDAVTPDRLDHVRQAGGRVILSRHSFTGMPSDFADWYSALVDAGADVVKIVGFAHEARDVLPVLRVLERAERPTIAIAMGDAGLPSRVLALRYPSCFLTYATLGSGERVAPGQLPLDEMRQVYHVSALGPSTRVFGILDRAADTAIAARLNDLLRAAGRDAVAVPVPGASDPGAVVAAYRAVPVSGWLIRDESAMVALAAVADSLTDRAREAGRLNVLTDRPGGLVGDLVEDLDSACEEMVSERSD